MAEAAAKTVLSRISQGHLDCPICRCRFTEPKILDCLHSFCLNCLDKLISGEKRRKDKIVCPVCRQKTSVPEEGLDSLPNCFFLQSLVDEFNKQEMLLGNTSLPIPTCQQCEDGAEAVARCRDCDENICKKCQEAHERWKRTKKHRIITVESLMNHKGVLVKECRNADGKTPSCRIHADYRVCFYCYTCEMSICAKCAAIDHRTDDHKYGEIGDVIRLFREEVDEALLKFENQREHFKVAGRSMEFARNRLKIMAAKASWEIAKKEEEEIEKIREKSRRLQDKVAEIAQERDVKYEEVMEGNREKMDRVDQIVATVTELMHEADGDELLDLKPKILHNLASPNELRFERIPYELSYIGIKCRDVVEPAELGEILRQEKWQLEREIGVKGSGEGEFKGATGVGCLSDGRIAVADTKNQRLTITAPASVSKDTTVQVGNDLLKAPYCIAVTSTDRLLVTDIDKVKVFDSNLQLVHQFTPSEGDEEGRSKSYLSGIHVDGHDRVVVADSGRKVISIHNLDGSLIATVGNAMIHGCVSMTNRDRLIFTNYLERRLVCVDLTGNQLFSVGMTIGRRSARPIGVCCDESGAIYVTTHYGQTGNCEVHLYDSEGAYVRRVARGLFNPFQATFGPGGDLVIADMHSIKIFQRV